MTNLFVTNSSNLSPLVSCKPTRTFPQYNLIQAKHSELFILRNANILYKENQDSNIGKTILRSTFPFCDYTTPGASTFNLIVLLSTKKNKIIHKVFKILLQEKILKLTVFSLFPQSKGGNL